MTFTGVDLFNAISRNDITWVEKFFESKTLYVWPKSRPIFGCITSAEMGRLLLKYGIDPYEFQSTASDWCPAIDFVPEELIIEIFGTANPLDESV